MTSIGRVPPRLILGAAIVVTALIAGVACSGGGSSKAPGAPSAPGAKSAVVPTITPDARPRPSPVPQSATQVLGSSQYGDPAASGTEQLNALECAADVLAITTSTRVVYAELPCDRALPADAAGRFIGHPVRVRVVPQQASKLYLDSQAAGSAEFTVGRVWVTAP